MAVPTIVWADLTDAEIDTLYAGAAAERDRRRIPREMDALAGRLLESKGVKPGDAWRPPSGGHDVYPQGWRVTRNGKQYESLIPGNTTEPGVDAASRWWKDLSTVTPANAWSAGKTVTSGQILDYQGTQYRVLQSHTTQTGWEPPVVPALFGKVLPTGTQRTPTPIVNRNT